MTSEVEICNLAISWVGGNLITSLGDDSKEAKVCTANYALLRDAMVESRDWTFAIQRLDLPLSGTSPVNGYANAFQIPSTTLRILDVNSGLEDWRVEGDSIVTNDGTLKMRAVMQVTDPNLFSSLFIQAFASLLASNIAIPITQSLKLQQQYYQLYLAKLEEAVTNDGMQGKSRIIQSSWLQDARRGGAAFAGPTVGGSSESTPKG